MTRKEFCSYVSNLQTEEDLEPWRNKIRGKTLGPEQSVLRMTSICLIWFQTIEILLTQALYLWFPICSTLFPSLFCLGIKCFLPFIVFAFLQLYYFFQQQQRTVVDHASFGQFYISLSAVVSSWDGYLLFSKWICLSNCHLPNIQLVALIIAQQFRSYCSFSFCPWPLATFLCSQHCQLHLSFGACLKNTDVHFSVNVPYFPF